MVQLIQLKFEVNTCTFSCRQARINVVRKVSTGFAFPLNWSRIWQEISELIIAGVRNIHTWKEGYQKSLKVTVFTQLEKRSNKILQQMLLYRCLLLNGSESSFALKFWGRFLFAHAQELLPRLVFSLVLAPPAHPRPYESWFIRVGSVPLFCVYENKWQKSLKIKTLVWLLHKPSLGVF